MDQESLESFARDWLAAWSGNRPSALLDFYGEDAYYQDPGRPEGLRGKEALGAYFRKLLAVNPEWIWSPVEVMATARGFTLKWEAEIPVGARTVGAQGLDIVEVCDGRIVRNEVFFDRTPLLMAMEQERKA